LFKDVPRSELEHLISGTQYRIQSHERDALIKTRGDLCDELVILLNGQVAGEFQDYDGHVLRVETISAPETIASAFLFAPEPHYPVNIVAITDVRICSMSRTSVVALTRQSEAVMSSLLADIGARTAFLAEKLRLMQFATLRQKVAGYLLERSQRTGLDSIQLPATHKTIAELFGVARPSLGRVLHELEESGVIKRGRHSIRIRNRQALTELLSGAD
jgi:CRP-like cAMP-binding protein